MRNITRSIALISCLAACGGDNNGDCQEDQTSHDGYCFGLEDNGKPYVTMPNGQAPPPDARDRDGDGWLECTVWLDGFCDCDDDNAAFNPRRFEECSDVFDYDCDGFPGPLDGNEPATWVPDLDRDGYGKRISLEYEVDTAANYDTDPTTNSWTLTGEGYEYGCDARVRMAGQFSAMFGADLKPADMPLVQINIGPLGPIDEDCDDHLSSVHPGGFESCNDLDDDCDGQTDEGPPADAGVSYPDADGDGFGAGEGGAFCPGDAPIGWVPTFTDCNDDPATGFAINPDATELPADDVDQNCDGRELCYADNDGDGVGAGDPVLGDDVDCTDPGESSIGTDCDDADVLRFPGNEETCNGGDDDCDGLIDDQDAVPAPTLWYADADMDGYGDPGASTSSCTQPPGSVASWTDCNDGDWAINPAAAEVCDALNVDENCSGLADDLDGGATGKTTWYRDGDHDSYGSTTVVRAACEAPAFTSATSDDCDDFAAAVNPGAIEIVHDGVDQNCNGSLDDVCPYDTLTINFYPALGFGSPNMRTFVRQVTAASDDVELYEDWTTTTPDGVWIQTADSGDTRIEASQCTEGLTQLNVRFIDEAGNIHCTAGGHQIFADLNGVLLSVGVDVDDQDLNCTEVIPLNL